MEKEEEEEEEEEEVKEEEEERRSTKSKFSSLIFSILLKVSGAFGVNLALE